MFAGAFLVAALCGVQTSVGAQTTIVTSIPALQAAINSAASGAVIQLQDGIYQNVSLNIGTSNIRVEAQTPGGVYLNGSNAITISGSYDTFSGFQFTTGSVPGSVISVTGSHNLLTELNFNGYSAQKYIVLQAPSQYNSVTWSNFQNKPASAPQGDLIHIDPDSILPGYHTISHNSFQHMPGLGGDNGNEPIRIGNGTESTYSSRTVVEYNYFEDTGPGDSEAISVKSRDNTLRWNTMRNNPDAMFVFRNGNNNVAYGNFFMYSGGIRIKEANNIYVYNNLFEYAGVGGTMDAVTYDYVSPNLNNINFIHNTFVEPNVISLGSGASANTWANNLLTKNSGSTFSGSPSGIAWAGNLYHGSLGITVPAAGATSVADVGLAPNTQGFLGLAPGSPAIDAASSSYPAAYDIPGINDDPSLALDVEGQQRPSLANLKDVGADELSGATTTNRPFALVDVGPSYLRPSIKTLSLSGLETSLTAGIPVIATVAASSGSPTVTLSTSSTGGGFSTSSVGPYTSSLSVVAMAAFYYRDTLAGSSKLTATTSGYTSATQSNTVLANGLSTITLTPASVTIPGGVLQAFSASGADLYGNPVSVSNAAWAVTNSLGAFSPAYGASTTFTSGQVGGSGTVSATMNGVAGRASLTVTALASMNVTITKGTTKRSGSTYGVPLTVTAKNAQNAALSGATVSLKVFSGSGCTGTALFSSSAITKTSGQVAFTFNTKITGTYCASASVTKAGYAIGRASTTFNAP